MLSGLLPARPRHPRQLRLPLPEGPAHAGDAAQGARLPHRRLRERLRAGLPLRPRPRLRRLRRPGRRRRGRGGVRDARAAAAPTRWPPALRWLESGDGTPVAAVPAPLRAPLAVRATRALRLALPRRRRTRARSRPPTPPSSRSLRPLLDGKRDGGRRSLVLTADHGEGLGDHGEDTHGVFAYEATLRVPLVLWAPRPALPARREASRSRLVDVLPTVLDLVGDRASRAASTAAACCRSRRADRLPRADTYFEALSSSLDRGWAPLYGIVAGTLKYVDLPIPELYDLGARPGGSRRTWRRGGPSDLERLRDAARCACGRGTAWDLRVTEDAATVEAAARARLRLRGRRGPKQRYGPDDDPKRLIGLERREAEILRRFRSGRLRRRPRAVPAEPRRAAGHVAHLDAARVDRARARRACRRRSRPAVAPWPCARGTRPRVALLGGLLVEAGRPEEARQVLAPLAAAGGARPGRPDFRGHGPRRASGAAARRSPSSTGSAGSIPATRSSWSTSAPCILMAGDLARAREAFTAAIAAGSRGGPRAQRARRVIAARGGGTAGSGDRALAARRGPRVPARPTRASSTWDADAAPVLRIAEAEARPSPGGLLEGGAAREPARARAGTAGRAALTPRLAPSSVCGLRPERAPAALERAPRRSARPPPRASRGRALGPR